MILPILVWLCVGLAALWIALALFDRWKRRTYNLTVAERSGSAAQPEFLTVDHDKRRETIARGRRPHLAADSAQAPPESGWSQTAGYAATVIAALTLITASITAIGSVERYNEMAGETVRRLTSLEQLGILFTDYWPGLLVAVAIIVVQVARFVSALRGA